MLESWRAHRHRVFWVCVAVVLATKLYILLSSTPDVLGDYSRLEALANDMLRSDQWLFDGGTDKYALPPAIWKTPGYPLLIAASKLALGTNWPWGLAILQSILNFVAGFFVYRFALALGFGGIVSAFAMVVYAWSVPASTDTLLMPDAVYGSLATMVVAALGMRFLAGRPLTLAAAFGAGLVIMVCFWVREGFMYLTVPFGIALIAPFWMQGASFRRTVLLLVVFCAPTILSAAGVMIWNRYRTGEYMVAIVSQTVYLITILKAAEKVPAVIGGDTLLERTARATLNDYDYGDAQTIDEKLFREHGIKAPELMRITQAKYWQTALHFPGTFAKVMWERFRFRQQASMLGDVLMRLDDLDWWRFVGPHKPYMSGWRLEAQQFLDTHDVRYLTPAVIVNAVPRMILRAVTLVIFVLFTFALPVVVLRDLTRSDEGTRHRALLFGALYLLYWANIGIYMLVTLEVRYLSPICSIPILGSIWLCWRLWLALPRWRGPSVVAAST